MVQKWEVSTKSWHGRILMMIIVILESTLGTILLLRFGLLSKLKDMDANVSNLLLGDNNEKSKAAI